MKFKIVVPAYNSEDYIGACLKSIASQNYQNFEVFVLDDNSSDQTPDIIESFCKTEESFWWKLNDRNMGAVANINRGIKLLRPKKRNNVVVLVDGDDWLAHDDVLGKVKSVYDETDCLLTYGTYVEHPSGRTPQHHKTDYSEDVIKNRSYRDKDVVHYSHLRTFRYGIWKYIDETDLMDDSGEFYQAGGDLSYIFPLLELAGDRVEKIDDVLYVYNKENPLNDHKVNRKEQLSTEEEIRNKERYPDKSDITI